MNWGSLSESVGATAPLIGSLLAGKPGAVVGQLVASAFGVASDPKEVLEALNRPDAGQVLRQLEIENHRSLLELHTAHDAHLAGLQATVASEVNQTMRAEQDSESWFYRGWRPLFGYMITIVFGAHMATPLVMIWCYPERLARFVEYTSATLVMWTLAFSVMGITVFKRSEDKKLKFSTPSGRHSAIDRITKLTKELHNGVN